FFEEEHEIETKNVSNINSLFIFHWLMFTYSTI
ncbi:MAG: hypothetical protein ACI9GZ_001006, partial [Bacteroidia bacterium]